MPQTFSPYQLRIIGVLLEKQITTPDQYPLSLNALTNACNQKSNRDPVMQLSQATVNHTVRDLIDQGVVTADSYRSRVEKYGQRFCNSQFGELQFSAQQVAVLAELFLRGPQTPGELRSRAARMAEFPDLASVEATLQSLAEHSDGPFVRQLPREPGRREARYEHRFTDGQDDQGENESALKPAERSALQVAKEEIAELQARCDELEAENKTLKERLRALGQVC